MINSIFWSSSAELSEAAKGLEIISTSHSVFGCHVRDRTKTQQKRPKYAGLIYFHAHVCLEVILEIARKRNKKGPNLLAQFISMRMCICLVVILEIARKRNKKDPNLPARFMCMYIRMFVKIIVVAVFTNFAATLASSLRLPRSLRA